jgi:hypothetical protein
MAKVEFIINKKEAIASFLLMIKVQRAKFKGCFAFGDEKNHKVQRAKFKGRFAFGDEKNHKVQRAKFKGCFAFGDAL